MTQSNVVTLFPEPLVEGIGPVRRAYAALHYANAELARAAIEEENRQAYARFETIAEVLRAED